MPFGLWLASVVLVGGCAVAVADSTVTGSGGGFSGSGTLFTTSNGDGSYTITSITGTDVLGLIAPNGFNGNDNLLFPTGSTLVDHKGFAFEAAEGDTQYQVDIFAATSARGGYRAEILDSDSIARKLTVDFALGSSASASSRELLAALADSTLADNTLADNRAFSFSFAATNAVAATPEPATFALLGTGFLGLAGVLRRRSREAGGQG